MNTNSGIHYWMYCPSCGLWKPENGWDTCNECFKKEQEEK